jgi:predicted glycoside hydrolase/deacetylase ChbG (UPF0249 family)
MHSHNDLNRRTLLKSACLSIGAPRILFGDTVQKKPSGPTLVQRLGYPADARVLILTADEFGECHASNVAIIKCWEAGVLKSITWQAPGPWAPEAAEYVRSHPGMDVGVHLTLTSGDVTGTAYRPILSRSEVPGLYTPEGYMWQYGVEAWKHTTADEIKRESRAQIKHAIAMGIDPTHIDPHDGIFNFAKGASNPEHLLEFAKLYGELAKEFSVPVRMSYIRAGLAALSPMDLRAPISRQGVLMNDEGLMSHGENDYRKIFHERVPGTVTELYIHPAVDCPELETVRGKRDWWKVGVNNFESFARDRDQVRQAIKDEGLIVIGWRAIRDLQRHERR